MTFWAKSAILACIGSRPTFRYFLPLFITVILKEACVRDHRPIGPAMLEYFSSPQGSCDSFIHSLSGMHAGAIQTVQECWDPDALLETQFGPCTLRSPGVAVLWVTKHILHYVFFHSLTRMQKTRFLPLIYCVCKPHDQVRWKGWRMPW